MNKLWIKKGKIGLWIIGLILTGCGEKVPNLSESHEKWYTHANSISVLSKGILDTNAGSSGNSAREYHKTRDRDFEFYV